ncbi:hypothetical protein [Bacteroides salyersiae]|jgi:hypothetical protein|uniref:hypothetical protein n=1 Tax=Bacteroides salyersiae TaxID=291644 RepID=UPI0003271184|nr:hypothetical protein [Bacteroides salyersiae]EOA50494.1 hypothetical protein HMPREF1532_01546 [Bacteroides salyersiae WAL 10018 = DSM 18765 = JCM 12988]MCS3058551.1 hypothetical protein [Bacteroides salyersiae]
MADWGTHYFSLRLTALLKPNDDKLKKGASGKSLPLAPELMQLKICAKKLYENWLVVGLGYIISLSEIFQFFL